jgi:hypothetical protein
MEFLGNGIFGKSLVSGLSRERKFSKSADTPGLGLNGEIAWNGMD